MWQPGRTEGGGICNKGGDARGVFRSMALMVQLKRQEKMLRLQAFAVGYSDAAPTERLGRCASPPKQNLSPSLHRSHTHILGGEVGLGSDELQHTVHDAVVVRLVAQHPGEQGRRALHQRSLEGKIGPVESSQVLPKPTKYRLSRRATLPATTKKFLFWDR